MLDVLRDASSDYLLLHDVAVLRGIHGECIQQLSKATISKSAIDFVLLESEQHEAPLRRKHGLVHKEPRTALILLGDYEIRGKLKFNGSTNALQALRQETDMFFPVTSSRLSRVNSTDQPVSAEVAIINGLKVSLVHVEQPAATLAT